MIIILYTRFILHFTINVIGQKTHEIEIPMNVVHMGYRLLEFLAMKWKLQMKEMGITYA